MECITCIQPSTSWRFLEGHLIQEFWFYLTDMVELTDQIASTLVQEGRDTVTATDKDVTQMRDQITTAVQAYVEENGDGITLKRMLALSKFNGMAKDICNLAEDLMISLVILPFHKNQYANGTLDGGNPGFRHVNRKVIITNQHPLKEKKIPKVKKNFLSSY